MIFSDIRCVHYGRRSPRPDDRMKDVLSYGMLKNALPPPRTIRRLSIRVAFGLMLLTATTRSAFAQQRPLITEDPEVIGAGRILVEGGIDGAHDAHYPLSGLEGNLWRVPALGVSFGISSIAELQIDGGPYNHLSITKRSPAPLSNLLKVTGAATSDVEDLVVATKIRLLPEAPTRPSFGIRLGTRLPNASNESGLGLDTDRLFRLAAGSQDSAIDPCRWQPGDRHPG